MLSNLHTHTNFCDGKNKAEEIVQKALFKGFSSIGFSGHGYTSHDLSYCMKDIKGYIETINSLKEKYKNDIQIYLGLEEDLTEPCKRENYDYIIGSSHYISYNGKYIPVDLSEDNFKELLKLFDGDFLSFAKSYYETFCDYILKRKPDIVGHFDLITKYSEYIFSNKSYLELSEKYIKTALLSDSFFEVNTGAMARGYRKTPYPYENILYVIKKNDGKIILNSDCHDYENLDFGFLEVKAMLKDIGFSYTYVLYDNEFRKDFL